MLQENWILAYSPSYGKVCRRINNQNIDIKKDKIADDDDLALGRKNTDIKVTNRSQWMDQKLNT